jgi:DNA modification methylase
VLRVKPGQPVAVTKDCASTDLWQVHHDKANFLHPTQKPTELAARAIRNSSRPGERVYDPFAGGGFVPLAAEREGRRALCMELDPKFVAVILERLSDAGLAPECVVTA